MQGRLQQLQAWSNCVCPGIALYCLWAAPAHVVYVSVQNEDDIELETSSEDFEEGDNDPEAGPAPDDAIQAAEPGSLLERIQQASKKQQK